MERVHASTVVDLDLLAELVGSGHISVCRRDRASVVTLLVEILYPNNRVVVDHGHTEHLVLLAAIDHVTGADVPLWEIAWPAAVFMLLRGDDSAEYAWKQVRPAYEPGRSDAAATDL